LEAPTTAAPRPLPAYAPFDGDLPEGARWLAPWLLQVPVGDPALNRRLRELCLELEAGGDGADISNVGGFHSKELVDSCRTELLELRSALHAPLAAFLWGQGRPPIGVGREAAVAAVLDSLWANVNRAGHFNARHDHLEKMGWGLGLLSASGAYYPDDGGSRSTKIRLFPEGGGEPVEVRPEGGSVLLFPKDVPHETDPVLPGEPARVSFAFNLFARWLDRPLFRAAVAGDGAELRRLAAAAAAADGAAEGRAGGLEAEDPVVGFRAAHLAAEAGQLGALQVLSELGADMAALSRGGWSPLGLAYERGM